MPRETTEQKAVRLLAAGAVTITRRVGNTVDAVVRGDHDAYDVQRRRGGWSCSCMAHQHRRVCSHTAAVRLVCDDPEETR